MKKNAYIWYSGPTDNTGKRLAEALKATHGKTKPTGKDKICICWGCKTDKAVNMGTMPVLNHPDKIRDNRHKFKTLQVLKTAGVYVANFVTAAEVMRTLSDARGSEPITLPLVGRRNYHQGGKGFWMCLTKGQVKIAIDQGAQYFQNYMDVKTEYRLHMFKGVLINGQKKMPRKNMAEAFEDQHGQRIKDNAAKKGVALDEATMKHVLGDIGSRQENPDQIVKSNTRGWKFSQVKTVPNALQELAASSMVATGLDFGAVDCCILEDGRAAIIEINTGPGLQGTPFDAYIKALKAAIADVNKPAGAKKTTVDTGIAKTGAKKVGKAAGKASPDKLRLMADMLELADEEESESINSVFNKMFGD